MSPVPLPAAEVPSLVNGCEAGFSSLIFVGEKCRDLVAGAGDTKEFVCIGVCRNLPLEFAVAPIDLAGIA